MTMASPAKLQMELGLERASCAHEESLEAARFLAELLGNKQAFVTADDVFKYFNPSALGAAAGAIFRDAKSWTFSHWAQSERESNHARPLRAWKLRASR